MQIFKKSIFILLAFITTSCAEKKSFQNDTFTDLIPKLKVLRSSFTYDLIKQNADYLYKTNSSEDSIFTNYPVSIIGLLPDTLENYKILYLQPGDDLYPTLRTYNKEGKLIDDHNICYNLCAGWDCNMDSCESSIKLISENKIERYLRVVKSDCDSLGNKIQSTLKTQTFKQIIKVDKNGKIVFGTEQIN